MARILIFFFFISFYLLSTWPGEYLLVRTLEDDYSPYSFEQLSKEEIGDTVMVILSGGMILGSLGQQAIREQKAERLLWLDFMGDIESIKN